MLNIFKKQHGMNIIGQGGKIILFMLPSLVAAIWVQISLPQIAALPQGLDFLRFVDIYGFCRGYSYGRLPSSSCSPAFPRANW